MKKIWRWIQQIPVLRQPLDGRGLSSKADYPGMSRPPYTSQGKRFLGRPLPFRHWTQSSGILNVQVPPSVQRHRSHHAEHHRVRPIIAFALTVLILTTALGQRYLRQPELQTGTYAPKTVIAPESVVVVDQQTTEERRAAARTGAVPVLIPDPSINTQIQNSLKNLFRQADIVRSQAGEFPFLPVNELSTATQTYLRETSNAEWDSVWTVVTEVINTAPPDETETPPNLSARLTSRSDFRQLNADQQQAVRELLRYKQRSSALDLEALQLVIETARDDFQRAANELQRLAQAERGLPNDIVLLRLSDSDWKQVQRNINLTLDQMLLQGVVEGLPSEQLAIAASSQLDGGVPHRALPFAKDVVVAVLRPNLIKDTDRTRAKAEAAAEQVPQVTVTVRGGEAIIQQGEEIDREAFVLLDHFGLSQRRLNVNGLIGFGLLVTAAVVTFLLAERTVRPGLRSQDHGLILCMLLGVAGLSILDFAVYSLPALGLLVSSFYGPVLGITLVMLVATLLPVGTQVSIVPLLASAAGGLVCSLIAPRLRSREELALLGGIVGLIQGAVYLILTWLISPLSLSTWYLPLTGAILQGIYGVVSSVVALGLSPYLEHLFDLVTPIRLAELSSPNRPMLQRLASEAPGTFQHTLFVASLAEAAARALRCNVELVRALKTRWADPISTMRLMILGSVPTSLKSTSAKVL